MGQINIDFQNKNQINATYTKLTLNEYISKPFSAVIECNIPKQATGSSNEFISNPLSYINEHVYIKVSQKNSNGMISYRYISGKITNILYKGIFKKDDKNNLYVYEITVQHPFVELMKNKKSKSYVKKNIKDIIKEILEENKIGNYDLGNIDDNELINRSDKILIYQHNETDYEFLMRLLLFYGINYYFYHINKKNKESTDTATLKFIRGAFFDEKFMDSNSDNRYINKLYLNLDKDDVSAGVFNNVTMNYNDSINLKNKGNISLYGFEYGNKAESITQQGQDKADIMQNINASLSYKNNTIKLSSNYVCVGINSKITIKGYLPDESIAKDMYLIKSTTTVYNNSSNEKDTIDILGFFADSVKQNSGMISEDIENTAALYFDNKIINKEPVYADEVEKSHSKQGIDLFKYKMELLEATVCDKDGNTVKDVNADKDLSVDKADIAIPEMCDKDNPTLFYAKLENTNQENDNNKTTDNGQSKVIVVNMVMPYGANNYYIYNYPEIGSKILVFYNNEQYYLFGYVPNVSSIISNQGPLEHSYLYAGIPKRNYINIEQAYYKHIRTSIYQGSIDSFMKKAYSFINMTCIKKFYEEDTSLYSVNQNQETISVKIWCAKLKAEYDNQIKNKNDKQAELKELMKNENKDDKKIKELNEDIKKIETSIETIESEIKEAEEKILEIFVKTKEDINNIISTMEQDEAAKYKEEQNKKIDEYLNSYDSVNVHSGIVDINGKNYIDIKGNNGLYLYSNANGMEISGADGSINIKAEKSIKLSVGSHFIEIDEDRISLVARKWMESAGPTDSSIFLESISGVDINGLSCSMNGLFSSSMSDAYGASIETSIGSSSIQGFRSGIYTLAGVKGVMKTIKNMGKLASQLGSISKHPACRYVNYSLDSGLQAINFGLKCYDVHTNKPESGLDKFKTAIEILELIFDVMDRVVTIMELEDPSYMHDKAKKDSRASKRDVTRLFLMTTKIITATTLFGLLLKKCGMVQEGQLEITGEDIDIQVKNFTTVTEETNQYNGPMTTLTKLFRDQAAYNKTPRVHLRSEYDRF